MDPPEPKVSPGCGTHWQHPFILSHLWPGGHSSSLWQGLASSGHWEYGTVFKHSVIKT